MHRPEFAIVAVYDVVHPFRFNGKDYAAGAKFDWRKIACDQRRLRNLYNARKISLPSDAKFVDPATVDPVGPNRSNLNPLPDAPEAPPAPAAPADAPTPADQPEAAPETRQPVSEAENSEGEAPATGVPVDEFKFDAETMTVSHRGAGHWFVMSKVGNEKIFGPLTQEQADQLVRDAG